MNRLFDKLFLLAYGLAAASLISLDAGFVAAFFTAAAVSSFCYVWNRKSFVRVCVFFYGAASCFYQPLLCFLPLTAYDIMQCRDYGFLLLFGISLFFHRREVSSALLFYVVFGILLSAFLEYKTSKYQELSELFRKTRDDSAERNLLLKEKNKSLMEKQDYEIYAATLKERNRIAREIHDNVGHLLSRSILMVGALKTINRQEPLILPMNQLDDTLSGAMDCIRRSVHDLRDDSVNLKEAVDSLISGFTKCHVLLEYDMPAPVPGKLKYAFLSILKEALSNIIKHSDASLLRLTLREHPGFYQLKIEDNGNTHNQEAGSGMGIQNMRDRIQALDGTLQIRKKCGFQIHITVPKSLDDET